MLVENAKSIIENMAKTLVSENPFFVNTRKKLVPMKNIEAYLFSIKYLMYHTPIFLKFAAEVAEKKGQHELASYYWKKIEEESGHYVWAENDLKSLGFGETDVVDKKVSAAIKDLLQYLKTQIEINPKFYLSYILYAEYMTVLAAPHFLDTLEEQYSIKRTQMSAVANHGELDKDHVQEDYDVINYYVKPEDKIDDEFLNVLSRSYEFFDRFL